MKKLLCFVAALGLCLPAMNTAWAHCEIPCGIYGDRLRVELLREDCGTIEKSMRTIRELGTGSPANNNQLVRWITNKEMHANKVQEVVAQYFLTQRVKPVADTGGTEYARYVTQVTLLHKMLIAAMKCKQTTDTEDVDLLRGLIDAFEKAYFEPEPAHEHPHEDH